MKLIYSLAISAFLWSISLSLLAPVEELYLESFTQDYALIGFALGIGSIGLLIFSPLMGKLSDIRGRKNLIFFFAFLGSIIPLLLVLSPSIEAYIFVRFLSGLSAALSPVLYAFLGDLFEGRKDEGFLFGMCIAGSSFGGAVGSILSGYVASFVGNLSTPYFLASLFSFASIIFLLPLSNHKEAFTVKGADLSGKFSSKKLSPLIIAVAALTFLFSFHFAMKGLLWPIIVREFVGVSQVPFYVAIIFASMGVLAAILSPLMGKIGDRFGNQRIFFLGSILLGVFGILLAFPGALWIFAILSVLYSFGESIRGPSGSAIISKCATKQNRGFIFGIIFSLAGLASFFGPLVTGYLLGIFEWRTILLAYGLAILLISLLFWTVISRLDKI